MSYESLSGKISERIFNEEAKTTFTRVGRQETA